MDGIRFQNGWGEGLAHQKARHMGAAMTPEIVILHDTASRLEPGNAATYLRDNDAPVSVHFVVERDGAVVQQVPTGRMAFHAGRSSFQGRERCNEFALGIEMVNPGRLVAVGGGKARSWFKQDFDIAAMGIQEIATPEHGAGLWMDYPAVQVEAVAELLRALFRQVSTLRDITAHWYVSPGRKVDTNPLFPLEEIRARILGRDDPADLVAETESEAIERPLWQRVATHGSPLNLRRWPSYNPNVVGQIPNGAMVPILRFGTFGGELWSRVRWDGREGWVLARYTTDPEPGAAP